ncbi:MAG: iron uptake porin [Cyanobacteria bacterium J06633_2]
MMLHRFFLRFVCIAPMLGVAIATQSVGLAQAIPVTQANEAAPRPLSVASLSAERANPSMSQVTSVSQLSDVQPTDWAFQALQSLVERYGCIAGFPDGTYRGNRALSRYEFAAGVNACLDRINELIAAGLSDKVSRDDLAVLQRLQEEFAAELATLRGRVDALEARTAELEANQFSTTTKLSGEVIFAIADAFGDGDISDNQTVFQNRVRLDFLTSFRGDDSFFIRLESGNADTFADSGLDQGELTFNFLDTDDDFVINALGYLFPAGDFDIYVAAAAPFWQDFVPVLSPQLDDITGGSGALSSFGESSPIYKIGLATGAGVGFNYTPFEAVTLSGGYFADTSADPTAGEGLFNGAYAALGQLTVTPAERLQFAFTYANAYFTDLGPGGGSIFDFSTGTATTEDPFNGGELAITNTYGIEAAYDISSRFAINAFGLFSDVQQLDGNDDAEIWSYGLGLAFPDLFGEGNLGGFIAGAEPYVGGDDDVALHLEGFYKYQLNDFISLTPGVIFIGAPGGENADDAVIGVFRTTFKF